MGLVSTVPSNAGDLMKVDASMAIRSSGFPGECVFLILVVSLMTSFSLRFAAHSQAAPSIAPKPTATDSQGVPQANTLTALVTMSTNTTYSSFQSGESCHSVCASLLYVWSAAYLVMIVVWNISGLS